MQRRTHSLLPSGRQFLQVAFALAACVMLGCPKPLPPEHVAAISKMQGLGGKVVFEDGGYRLNLTNSRVQDEDLDVLQNVENLKILDVRGTQITDEGAKKFIPLKSLTLVILTGSRITDEGVEALKKSRPDLRISK